MYWAAYLTNAHRIGIGIDVFVFNTTVKDKSLHFELLLGTVVLNLSIGKRDKRVK